MEVGAPDDRVMILGWPASVTPFLTYLCDLAPSSRRSVDCVQMTRRKEARWRHLAVHLRVNDRVVRCEAGGLRLRDSFLHFGITTETFFMCHF